ncbi:hypothetical protein T4E_6894 [Trichinella pseudospiralis]|uniref:Uncharacterized protein n=1 Tax=Trichinella pseudospiralis TaxID=6337 RepID=A0A0V0XVP4_TRIPS|nr:hypothetical protein T4E_6894 [Trichinella pseudospiralis]
MKLMNTPEELNSVQIKNEEKIASYTKTDSTLIIRRQTSCPQAEIETMVWNFNSAMGAFLNQLIVILLKMLKNKI